MVVRLFMRGLIIKEVGRRPSISFASFESRPLVDTELRVRVLAAGVNRADLLQARGLYPPPPGASKVLGLECAGEVLEVGGAVKGWQKGDRAMALRFSSVLPAIDTGFGFLAASTNKAWL